MMATRAPKHSLLLAASVVAAAAAAARAAATSSSGGASYAHLYESGVVTAYARAVLFGVVWALSLYVAYLVSKKPAPKAPPPVSPPPRAAVDVAPAGESAFLAAAPPVLVVYASVTGTSRGYALRLRDALARAGRRSTLVDACDEAFPLDPWDELLNGASRDCAVLVSTQGGGACPPRAAHIFEAALDDLAHDHRVGTAALRGRRFGVLGCGSTAYEPAVFCAAAKKCERALRKLGASRVASAALDDCDGARDAAYGAWEARVAATFAKPSPLLARAGGLTRQQRKKVAAPRALEPVAPGSDDGGSESDEEAPAPSGVADLEELGPGLESRADEEAAALGLRPPKDMVTPAQAKALKKEGYKLIGSHSAVKLRAGKESEIPNFKGSDLGRFPLVKLCRWTKHQLRGRGGCYKHTFYGITSYQCMEATPSLACANKPTTPEAIVAEAVDLHVAMIKECRGVPGVVDWRWRDAHTVRHCALSLVGEPIMYPRINELLGELHGRRISTFLVTNAQFPEAIRTLRPVTQLYVSVDAPNEADLVEVDRPLFGDAWDRLRASLVLLREKRQRTPTLVEVKGVTFCGKSDASDLTMENCPWHHEVVAFCEALAAALAANHPGAPEYRIACSHKHSVSVLLARVDQLATLDDSGAVVSWNTWIDYDKFHDLERAHAATGAPFGVEDYAVPAPPWALFGAAEDGFDPVDTRVYKKKANGKSR
ncbi:tRNA-4-demethylwyosine synthase [Aureococcus anophagefferens]|nr:tRNA-4-demethylwyosine synthase [Aureococcus anophagefferens]